MAFLALHLPYLPASLEDLDSINFALGVRHFDVAQHQPHPPGYPVFILIGKAARVVLPDEARALALVGVVAGALGVVAMAALFGRLDATSPARTWALIAAAVAMTSPIYWFTAARPLSDMTGLAAALAVQAMTLGATSTRSLMIAGFGAGLATGLRSQVAWLTVPLLIVKGLGITDWGSVRQQAAMAAAFVAGVVVWFVPLIVVSGGPSAYWHALFNQGAEDLGNITMLWTTHNARVAADALYYAFVAPWATWTIAIVMLALTIAGLVWISRRDRPALVALAAAFGPYLVFDLLFQETFTGRYALPLVIPIAYLAVAGLRLLPWQSGVLVATAIAMFDAHAAGTSLAAYSREKAPAFRLLDDMASTARATAQTPVLAMDRRNSFDFRRSIVWTDGAMPKIAQHLPAPPQHEWLEAVKYWNGGGRAPVWFVVDPKRTSIDLVQHGAPARYRWPLPYPELVSGARPDEMDWYRVDRPEWYVGEGWALTPEAAGVAEADRRDLSHGPIDAWINPGISAGALMIGGRNFEPRSTRLSVLIEGESIADESIAPGPFLRFTAVPDALRRGDYSRLTVRTDAGARVAVEQFDMSTARPLVGFGAGWHEQEFNPRTGVRWRWLSERGDLQLRAGAPRVSLHVEGESPRTYFSRGSHFVVRSRDRIVFDRVLTGDFSLDIPIADVGDSLVLETDQVWVPAERSRRTQDRRHLGLRIFRCEITRP